MKHKFLITAGVLLALITTGYVAWANMQSQDKTYSWRYKMTVEIETPEGVKSGSAIREVTINFKSRNDPDSRNPQYDIHKSLKGEAVVIDLGDRGKVFALMKGPLLSVDYGSSIPFYVFKGPPGLTIEGAKYYSSLKGKKELSPAYYPMFITFTNINDPKTVVSLIDFNSDNNSPVSLNIERDYFKEYFGDGIKLKSVVLEMTTEAETWGIEKIIPWLPDRKYVRGYLGSKPEPPYDDPTKTYLNGTELSVGKFW